MQTIFHILRRWSKFKIFLEFRSNNLRLVIIRMRCKGRRILNICFVSIHNLCSIAITRFRLCAVFHIVPLVVLLPHMLRIKMRVHRIFHALMESYRIIVVNLLSPRLLHLQSVKRFNRQIVKLINARLLRHINSLKPTLIHVVLMAQNNLLVPCVSSL